LRYYKYNQDYYYTGYVDSETVVTSSTTEIPLSSSHIIWNPDTNVWEEEPIEVLTLDEEKERALFNVRSYFEDIMSTIKSGIANFEEETYRTQEEEWRAWNLDPNVQTPYVDILCFRRNIDKPTLMGRIGQKVSFFADIQGQMHALEDAVNNCTSKEQIDSIPYPWL